MSNVDARRRRVEELRRESRSLRSIAAELGVSQVTVLRDVRVIEAELGEPLTHDVEGEDGKPYMAKVSGQEWEDAAFDPPPEPPAPKEAGDHLQEAAEAVDRALAALQAGHWQADVPELLSHLQAVLPKVRAANEALPRP